jgi:hypothetical protein
LRHKPHQAILDKHPDLLVMPAESWIYFTSTDPIGTDMLKELEYS